jgi:hypothetical protein
MMLLHLIVPRRWAIGSKDAQWVLEHHPSSIALANTLGLDAVAAYGLLFPAFDSTFATCYGSWSIICIPRSIYLCLHCLLKQPVLVRLFGALRGPGCLAAGGSVDWPRSVEAIAADCPGPSSKSSSMMVMDMDNCEGIKTIVDCVCPRTWWG